MRPPAGWERGSGRHRWRTPEIAQLPSCAVLEAALSSQFSVLSCHGSVCNAMAGIGKRAKGRVASQFEWFIDTPSWLISDSRCLACSIVHPIRVSNSRARPTPLQTSLRALFMVRISSEVSSTRAPELVRYLIFIPPPLLLGLQLSLTKLLAQRQRLMLVGRSYIRPIDFVRP